MMRLRKVLKVMAGSEMVAEGVKVVSMVSNDVAIARASGHVLVMHGDRRRKR